MSRNARHSLRSRSHRRRPRTRRSAARPLLQETLEFRYLLSATPISTSDEQLLAEGGNSLASFGSRLDQELSAFSLDLPLDGAALSSYLRADDILTTALVDPLRDYFSDELEPDSDGLASSIQSHLANFGIADGLQFNNVVVQDVSDGESTLLDVQFLAQRDETLILDLATQLQDAGLSISAGLEAPLTLQWEVAIQFGLDASSGSTAEFFVQFGDSADNQFAARMEYRQPAPGGGDPAAQFRGSFGLLGVTAADTTLDYQVNVDLDYIDSRLTADDLLTADVSSLVAAQPTAGQANALAISFPLTTDLLNQNDAPLIENAPFVVRDNDTLDGQFDLSSAVYADLAPSAEAARPFSLVAPAELLGALGQLESLLSGLTASPGFEKEIPLTGGRTLGDIVDLGTALADEIVSPLRGGDGQPAFGTVQEAAANVFDSVRYQEATVDSPALVEFEVNLFHLFDVASFDLDFGFDLGDLSSIETSSTLDIEADAAGRFILGVKLQRPDDGVQITYATALDELNRGHGVLLDDAGDDIRVTLRRGDEFRVDLTGAVDLADVVQAIHAAAPADLNVPAAPGEDGEFDFEVFIHDDNGLTVRDHTAGDGALRVERAGDSLAGVGLGIAGSSEDGELVGSPLHGRTLADNLYLRQVDADTPMFSANARLIADDFDATAQLGFVSLDIVNGEGLGQLTAALSLGDPGGDAFDGRVTLAETNEAFGEAAFRLVASNPVDFAENAADSYVASLSITIEEDDGSLTELQPQVSVTPPPQDTQPIDHIVAVVKAALAGLPGGDRIKAGHSGDRLSFALADGVARRVTVTSMSSADERLGFSESQQGYLLGLRLTGSADFDLPLEISLSGPGGLDIGGLTLPGAPSLAISIPDLSLDDLSAPGAVTSDSTGIGDLAQFGDLPLTTIVLALRGGFDYLQQVEGFNDLAILNQELPLIGVSLREILDIANGFGDVLIQFEQDPASSLGDLDEVLGELLGYPVDLSYDSDNQDLRIDLEFETIINRDEGDQADLAALTAESGFSFSDAGQGDTHVTRVSVTDPAGNTSELTDFALRFMFPQSAYSTAVEYLELAPEFSVAAWVKPDDVTGQQQIAGANSWELLLDDGELTFASQFIHVYPSGATLNVGQWTHVMAAFGANGQLQFYVNGELVAEVEHEVTIYPEALISLGGMSSSHYLTGTLDDVAFWDRALSPAEAEAVYEGVDSNDPNLVAYFPFREGVGFATQNESRADDSAYLLSATWSTDVPDPVTSYEFENEGVYRLDFSVADDDGGVDQTSTTVAVANLSPSAQAQLPTQALPAGQEIILSAAASSDPGPHDRLRYRWSVESPTGDTIAVSDLAEFPFTPPYAGVFDVTLTITDPAGASDQLTGLLEALPVIDIAADSPLGSAAEGDILSFSARHVRPSAPGAAIGYAWLARDSQGQPVGTGSEPIFRFRPRDDGDYTISVVVQEELGSGAVAGSASVPVQVVNAAPRILAGGDRQASQGLVTIEVDISDPGMSEIVTVDIDWGDSTSSTGLPTSESYTHNYSQPGDYLVAIDASDTAASAPTSFFTLTVENVAPGIQLGDGNAIAIDEGASVSIGGIVDDPVDASLEVLVDYGDGSAAETHAFNSAQAFQLAHTYTNSGWFEVTVSVSDAHGDSNAATQRVQVRNDAPQIVDFSGSATATTGQAATFNGELADYGGDRLRAALDYGDGVQTPVRLQPVGGGGQSQAYTFAAKHVFQTGGQKTVTLIVIDEDGAGGQQQLMVDVALPPLPEFSISGPDTILEGDSGQASLVFDVSLSQPPTLPVAVDVSAISGSAVAGVDFLPLDTRLMFNPTGPLTQQVTVQIVGDPMVELDEVFSVRLNNVGGQARIANGSAQVTIDNDDSAELSIAGRPILREGDKRLSH